MQTAAPFNIFQRLVRQWDELHPYNAAQVLKISGRADIDLLRQTWHEALDDLGIGCVRVNGKGYRHASMNGEAQSHSVCLLPAGTRLEDHLSGELNRPFDPDDSVPFRPFVIDEGESHWVGVVYQHWIADSASIRRVLREWFCRAFDPASAVRKRLRIADAGYWQLFGPRQARWQLAEGLLSSLRWGARFKRVRRIEGKRFSNFTTQFTLSAAPAGTIDSLRLAARAAGATVNDIFLAAIAEACNRHLPIQRTRRRQDVALGAIVDLRPHVQEDLSDVFGLFLGFTSVICRPRHFRDWNTLLSAIATQSAHHKLTGVPQQSVLRMMAGLAAGKLFSREQVVSFYRKRVPLAGGISNVNLNQTWAARYHPAPLLDYVRVSPTGPMMPLVFTASTLGKQLNVGLTFRESVVPPEMARSLSHMFMDRLAKVGQGNDERSNRNDHE